MRTALPRRADFPAERGLLVTAAATHKQKDLFFFLLQTEVGDLYKVTLEYDGDLVRLPPPLHWPSSITLPSIAVKPPPPRPP